MRHTLKKPEILRGRKSFENVMSAGKRIDGRTVRCFVLCRPAGEPSRVAAGFAVSRKLKRAADRNRVRRLMKEAFRTQKHLLVPWSQSQAADMVFLFAPPAGNLTLPSFADISADIQNILLSIAGA